MWTRSFWIDTAERFIRTIAQTLASIIVVGQTSLLDIDWQQTASIAAGAGLAALVTALAGARTGDPATASLLPATAEGDEVGDL